MPPALARPSATTQTAIHQADGDPADKTTADVSLNRGWRGWDPRQSLLALAFDRRIECVQPFGIAPGPFHSAGNA